MTSPTKPTGRGRSQAEFQANMARSIRIFRAFRAGHDETQATPEYVRSGFAVKMLLPRSIVPWRTVGSISGDDLLGLVKFRRRGAARTRNGSGTSQNQLAQPCGGRSSSLPVRADSARPFRQGEPHG